MYWLIWRVRGFLYSWIPLKVNSIGDNSNSWTNDWHRISSSVLFLDSILILVEEKEYLKYQQLRGCVCRVHSSSGTIALLNTPTRRFYGSHNQLLIQEPGNPNVYVIQPLKNASLPKDLIYAKKYSSFSFIYWQKRII